jgi:chromosome segregation ATPase
VFRRRSSLSWSKRGFVAVLLGALILFGLLLYGLASISGRLIPVVDYVSSIVNFLGTGPGVLLSVIVAVLLILWASHIRQSRNKINPITPSSRAARERQRLSSALQESELRRKQLKLALREGELEREQLKEELQEGQRKRDRLRVELRVGERERERLELELREGKRDLERQRANLQAELQKHDQERKRLRSEIEQLRTERRTFEEKLTTYDSRIALKRKLNAAYWEGLQLRRRTLSHRRATSRRRRPSDEAATKWAIRTSELIKEALGEGQARRFLGANGGRSSDSSATERQEQLDERLKWLAELIQRVDSFEPLELEAGFQSQEQLRSQ